MAERSRCTTQVCGRPHRRNRFRQAGQPVAAHEQRVAAAAIAQLGEHPVPELGALGLLDPDAQDLLDAVDVDPDHHVSGLVGHDAAVADLEADGVDIQDRIHRVDRSGLPGRDLLGHHVSHPRNRGRRDTGAVDLAQMLGDVASRHAAGIQRQDHVLDLAQAAFAFGHDRRGEGAVAVTRHFELDRARGGQHGFAAVPIAGIARSVAGWIAVLIAQMIGDFDIQSAFEHGFSHLRKQPIRAIDWNTGCLGISQQGIHCRRRQQLGQLGRSIIPR
jgi:hypothetical protein